ncbi:MAG: SH3 domain-containing protein [Oscillospiraceae bacterium]|nr:SH3 domain-containing protein [Oscillospiraceae bacterium]
MKRAARAGLALLAALLFAVTALAADTYQTTTRVNLRQSDSTLSAILKTLEANVSVSVESYDAQGWSKVSLDGLEGYIKSEYIKKSADAVAPAVYKTTTRVNLRKSASTVSAVLKTLEAGVRLEVSAYDAAGWSQATVNGLSGFIKSEYITKADQAATAATPAPPAAAPVASVPATPTPDAAPSDFRTTTRVNLRQSASTDSAILKTLNAGVKVDMLTYDGDNWSKVSASGQEGYIKSEYLVDVSVLGDGLQAGDVELIPWSEAKPIFKTYTPARVYDVRSGKVYYVQSFSNGSHADVEPLTKQDTEIMFATFSRKWSWAVRPVWVTIGGHTMAASINGMPHGGGVISDNGMDGQICIHFLGSTTHNGNTSFAQAHQDGVMEAWNAAK